MEYTLLLGGVDITEKLKVQELFVSDASGAKADRIKMQIINTADAEISRGQRLTAKFGGYTSGNMIIDEFLCGTATSRVGAISCPKDAKKQKTRHYMKVRFFDIVNDIATETGLSVFYDGVSNFLYENVTRFNETALAFLNRLCIREGYSLKIDDLRIIIFDKAKAERSQSVLTVKPTDIVENKILFSENPNLVASVTVKHYNSNDQVVISRTAHSGFDGENKVIREYCATIAEAERFANGYVREMNKNAVTVTGFIKLNTAIAATNNIECNGFGRFDGKYFIEEITHDPINELTKFSARKL